MGQLVTILYLSTLFFTIFLVAVIIWYHMWFKRYGGKLIQVD